MMRILELRSRWQIAAVCVTAFAVTVSLASWQYVSAKDDIAAEESLTGKVEVSVPATLLKVGKTYFVDVKVKNATKEALEGPVLLIVKSTSLEGLSVKNAQRTLESGESVFEIIADGRKLAANRTTKRTRITFESEKTLRTQDRRQFKLNYRIVRQILQRDRESSSKQAGRQSRTTNPPLPTAPRSGNRSSSGSRTGNQGRRNNGRNGDSKNSPKDDAPDANDGPAVAGRPYPTPEELRRVMDIQESVTNVWLRKEGVVGTSTSRNARGDLVVRVYIERAGISKTLPNTLQGVPVVTQVTGKMRSLQPPPPQDKNGQAGAPNPRPDPTCTDNPQIRFERPIPIGVSGINIGAGCSTGTIGCRLKGRDGQLYALSNNHVFALENAASVGDMIVQPGPLDSTPICAINPEDSIGTLFDFQPIDFTFFAPNLIDAAIIKVSDSVVGRSTPCSGYGTPYRLTAEPFLGMKVQKYGRTSSLRTAEVTSVNAISFVLYGPGLALFFEQIEFVNTTGGLPLGEPGDSGSLIVTSPGRQPVALLFAGSAFVTLGNPIDKVLEAFDVEIDGEEHLPVQPVR